MPKSPRKRHVYCYINSGATALQPVFEFEVGDKVELVVVNPKTNEEELVFRIEPNGNAVFYRGK